MLAGMDSLSELPATYRCRCPVGDRYQRRLSRSSLVRRGSTPSTKQMDLRPFLGAVLRLNPQVIDQASGGQHPVGMPEENRKPRARLRFTQNQSRGTVPHLNRLRIWKLHTPQILRLERTLSSSTNGHKGDPSASSNRLCDAALGLPTLPRVEVGRDLQTLGHATALWQPGQAGGCCGRAPSEHRDCHRASMVERLKALT
jgi:hypothetical protein